MRKYVFILFLLVVPLVGRAQFNFDFLSVEAMIDNHKSVRSVLTARSGVEQANELLHDYSQAAAVDYDSLNVKLDKYTKCFDIIDIIYNSGVMVVNVKNTSADVTDKIGQLNTLIENFVNQCTLRGDILSSDRIIIDACNNCVAQVGVDSKQLLNSIIELAQYATGFREITTAELLTVIGSINESLDNIRGSIDHAYFVIWKYITIRTHYFKKSLYQAKNIREMCGSAIERWMRGAKQASGYSY